MQKWCWSYSEGEKHHCSLGSAFKPLICKTQNVPPWKLLKKLLFILWQCIWLLFGTYFPPEMEYQTSQRFGLDLPRLPFIGSFKAFTYTYYKNQTRPAKQTNKQKKPVFLIKLFKYITFQIKKILENHRLDEVWRDYWLCPVCTLHSSIYEHWWDSPWNLFFSRLNSPSSLILPSPRCSSHGPLLDFL